MDAPERAAAGKAARSEAPRSAHAAWEPAADRDPVAILERQALTRVPELVPIRYGRMALSPFAFFRGAAAVMAADLATAPDSGLRVQACGDAHLSNFGAFAAPDRRLVFDLNDFDESLPGPWEWDLKRLAASFAIAGRENGLKGKERGAAVLSAARTYREAMRGFASLGNLEVWYARLDVEAVLAEIEAEDPASVKRVRKGVAKAHTKDSLRALEKLTHVVDGELRIRSEPPLIVPAEELMPAAETRDLRETFIHLLDAYRATLPADRQHLLDGYSFRHIARKVVGVGSVGTRAWVVLLTGADDGDPLFLQAKEAEASVLEPYAGKSRFKNYGRRVVEGQRLMQAASDIFLGWCPAVGLDGRDRDFYVRQLWDWKRSVEVERLSPRGLEVYGWMCGWTLARAHARSGDRVAIGAYLGAGDGFDRAIAEFAQGYAEQSERDHAALVAAIDSGRIEAQEA
ncbi:MAG TPA: DUF2252 domain-containing protein [Solirubrobacterales bacterium]|jgi:uncharacterized protein (DUF2252 family)|nr:DUF2252 domain-containing protein [Solirubrobacterales bacterium]